MEPLLKLCITLVNVGFPLSLSRTASFAAPLLALFIVVSDFFCKDRLIAANAASFRGLPLGASREAGGLAGVPDGVIGVVDLDKLFLSENLGKEDGTDGLLGCEGRVDADGAVHEWSFGCRCDGQNECLQD